MLSVILESNSRIPVGKNYMCLWSPAPAEMRSLQLWEMKKVCAYVKCIKINKIFFFFIFGGINELLTLSMPVFEKEIKKFPLSYHSFVHSFNTTCWVFVFGQCLCLVLNMKQTNRKHGLILSQKEFAVI